TTAATCSRSRTSARRSASTLPGCGNACWARRCPSRRTPCTDGSLARGSRGVTAGGSWLVAPVGSAPQFTGADFTEDDLLYAKTAEDFVRHEVLTRLAEIEEKRAGVMPELLKRAGALGLLMIDIPERYGGLGLHKTT